MPCPLCGSESWKPVLTVPVTLATVEWQFRYVRCRDCGLVRLNPRPKQDFLLELYEQLEVVNEHGDGELFGRAYLTDQVSRREFVERHAGRGRLLDIGSGDGQFLHELKMSGWDAEAVEPVTSQAEFQRNSLGLEVHTGTVDEIDFGGRRFDIITLWSVLEHVPDPRATLARVSELLAPGGRAVVGVPNLRSVEAKIFGARWNGLGAPFHLFMFEPASMRKMAESAGLRVCNTIYASTASTMLQSLKSIIKSNDSPAADSAPALKMEIDWSPRAKSAKNVIFDRLVVPAYRLIDALHLGTGTIFILEK